MTGTPRQRKTFGTKVKDMSNDINSLYHQKNQTRFVATGGVPAGSGTGGISSVGNYLPTAGGTMIGPIAFFPASQIISSDTLDVSSETGNYTSYIIALGEGSANDNLIAILGAGFAGQQLFLQGVIGIDITIKHKDPSGNIRTIDGNDFVLTGNQIAELIFDPAANEWALVGAAFTGGGGGGSFSEPVLSTVAAVTPQTLPTKTQINVAAKNVHSITLDRDIEIDLVGTVPAGKLEYVHLLILQDGTGNWDITWDTAINGKPNIGKRPTDFTSVSLFTYDAGVTWYFVSNRGGTVGQDLSGWAVFPAIENIKAANHDITQVKNLDFDDPLSTITGLANISFVNTNQSINSLSTGLEYQTDAVKHHEFIVGGVPVALIEEITAGVYQLNMKNHKIKDSRELIFNTSAAAVINNVDPVIGYDLSSMIFNVPTAKDLKFKVNNAIVGTLDVNGLKNLIDVRTDQVTIQPSAVNPAVDGVMRSVVNGAVSDVKVGTGGGVLNLTDLLGVGIPNQIKQGDSEVTVTDIGVGNIIAKVDSIQKMSITPSLVSVGGHIDLGNFDTDKLTINSSLNSDIVPFTDAVHHLGSLTKRFVNLYGSTVILDANTQIALTTAGIALKSLGIGDLLLVNVGPSGTQLQVAQNQIDFNVDLRMNGNDIVSDVTTGTKIATSSSEKLGFWGHTPSTRRGGWILNFSTRRQIDSSSITLSELADAVATLIDDHIQYGLTT